MSAPAAGGYRDIFRKAGERWLDGDRGALDDFERGIAAALEEGDVSAALAAHQKLLAWAPAEADRHERVARAIAAARDRQEHAADASPSLESVPLFSGVPRDELVSLLTAVEPVRAAAGIAVVEEGQPGDSLYLVVAGTLSVATEGEGESVEVGRLGPRGFFRGGGAPDGKAEDRDGHRRHGSGALEARPRHRRRAAPPPSRDRGVPPRVPSPPRREDDRSPSRPQARRGLTPPGRPMLRHAA